MSQLLTLVKEQKNFGLSVYFWHAAGTHSVRIAVLAGCDLIGAKSGGAG